ncbi:MAG: tRNA preQ1(34) S-adenosylmethionine ribosyltransferase-isomerase QueA, partial [Deltaproteobacteria bacterium]
GGRCAVEAVDAGIRAMLDTAGRLPLPPYIGRDEEAADRTRYQTIYARVDGSVAAPTAGLHFSPAVIEQLRARGIDFLTVTLHVGPGTFVPIRSTPDQHRMEAEWCRVPGETAEVINRVHREGGRVVAVGTTTVRTLESAADERGRICAREGSTSLFIRPGYRFRIVDGLVTNFHLPRTTLLCLVMALAGCEPVRAAYRAAIAERYRFYSYGDAMLIL